MRPLVRYKRVSNDISETGSLVNVKKCCCRARGGRQRAVVAAFRSLIDLFPVVFPSLSPILLPDLSMFLTDNIEGFRYYRDMHPYNSASRALCSGRCPAAAVYVIVMHADPPPAMSAWPRDLVIVAEASFESWPPRCF